MFHYKRLYELSGYNVELLSKRLFLLTLLCKEWNLTAFLKLETFLNSTAGARSLSVTLKQSINLCSKHLFKIIDKFTRKTNFSPTEAYWRIHACWSWEYKGEESRRQKKQTFERTKSILNFRSGQKGNIISITSHITLHFFKLPNKYDCTLICSLEDDMEFSKIHETASWVLKKDVILKLNGTGKL